MGCGRSDWKASQLSALASILRCVTLTLLFSQRNARGKNKVPTKKNAKYQLLYLNGHPLHVSMGVDLGVWSQSFAVPQYQWFLVKASRGPPWV